MNKVTKTPTGIAGLDRVLGGGIIKGDAVLVQGAPGAGKTTLGLQFIYEGAVHYQEPGLVVTFEEFPRQMFRDAANFGWDLQALVQEKKVQVVCTSPHVFQKHLQSPDGIIYRMLHEGGVERVLVDSVTHLHRITTDPVQLRELLNSLLNVLRQGEFTTFLTQEVQQQEAEISFEQYSVDAVIRLFFEAVDKVQRRRFLEVLKARGQSFIPGKHSFQIGARGLEVYPTPRPGIWSPDGQPKVRTLSPRRIETGVPGLDRMLGGGVFEGFSVLVAGDAGSGKSTLARQFITHGIQRGEQALYVALRETPEKIVSAAAMIGLDLQPMIDDGALTILHRHPVDLDAYQLFWETAELVQNKPIQRAVVDSLTDIEPSIIEPNAFRDYVYSLVDLFSSNGVTSVLTLNVTPSAVERDLVESDLAMVMDAILALRFRNVHDHIRKTISILKIRGSEHDTGIRPLRIITGEGMMIETGFEGVPSFLRKLQQLSPAEGSA